MGSVLKLENLIQLSKEPSKHVFDRKFKPGKDHMSAMYATAHMIQKYIKPMHFVILMEMYAFKMGRQRWQIDDLTMESTEVVKTEMQYLKKMGLIELLKKEYSRKYLYYLTQDGILVVRKLFALMDQYINEQPDESINVRGNLWGQIRDAARAEKDEYNELVKTSS